MPRLSSSDTAKLSGKITGTLIFEGLFGAGLTALTGGAGAPAAIGKIAAKISKIVKSPVVDKLIDIITEGMGQTKKLLQTYDDEFHLIGKTGCFVAGTTVNVVSRSLEVCEKVQIAKVNSSSEVISRQPAALETQLPIENVRLGDRVSTRNPLGPLDRQPYSDRTYDGWLQVSIEFHHSSGIIVDMELLRSSQWVVANNLRVNGSFDILLEEMELDGYGVVKAISSGPPVASGSGSPVTGLFKTRRTSDLVKLTFEGGIELVGTRQHPIWSPLHEDWIPMGDLIPGERVLTRSGHVAVLSVISIEDSLPVYNIEVESEHTYEVTALGILVHRQ